MGHETTVAEKGAPRDRLPDLGPIQHSSIMDRWVVFWRAAPVPERPLLARSRPAAADPSASPALARRPARRRSTRCEPICRNRQRQGVSRCAHGALTTSHTLVSHVGDGASGSRFDRWLCTAWSRFDPRVLYRFVAFDSSYITQCMMQRILTRRVICNASHRRSRIGDDESDARRRRRSAPQGRDGDS